ncbi:MAG: hypothetical protein ACKOD6_03220 [Actinomycetota bacterium]
MKKLLAPLISLALLGSTTTQITWAASPKAGATCSKVGVTKRVGTETLKCTQKGKKRIWVKSKVAPTPTPTPTPTPRTLTIYQSGAGKPGPVKTNIDKVSAELTFNPATAPTGTNLKVWVYDPEDATKSLNSPGLFYRKLDGDWIYKAANNDGTVFLTLTSGSYLLSTVEPNGNIAKYSRKNYAFVVDEKGVASTVGLLPNSTGFFTLTIDLRATTTVTTTPSPTATFVPKNSCQLQGQDGNLAMNQGFPHRSERLPVSGVIKAIMIPVDFPDVVGTGNPAEVYYSMAKGMDDFYRKVSAERVSFSFQVLPTYIRMDFKSDKYNLGKWSSGDALGYWRATLEAADPYVDYSLFDVVYVLSPQNIPSSSIAFGPAFPFRSDTNDGPVNNGTFSGADAYQNFPGADWKWISHETGHLFGLHDLYTDGLAATYGSWDLMSLNWSTQAIELNSWNRYISDWLDESQIDCITLEALSSTPMTRTLTPLVQSSSGIKSQLIRLSSSLILVAEYRTTGGLDVIPSNNEGVLVYTVDMTIPSIKGGWKTQRRIGSIAPDFTDATLKSGDSVIVNGVTISVTSVSSSGAQIKISKN